jgi:hypothetical protein
MWAAMLHLALGNALIGIFEGLLLAKLFKVPNGKAMTFMVIANYFSAWVGGLFLRGVIVRGLPLDLNNAWKWFWVMVVVTYAMTIILELPFILGLLRGTNDALRRSLRASFIVQSASYVIIFGWYWMASGTSLYTKMHVVSPAELALPDQVLVYFISAQDGDVYSARLNSGAPERVMKLGSTDKNDRLLLRPELSNHWDLVARIETQNRREPHFVPVVTNLFAGVAPDPRTTNDPSRLEGTWFNFGTIPALGEATNSKWKFSSGFWPVGGLGGRKAESNEKLGFSYETPFGAWNVRNAVLLPTDKVLFQLGDDQICAFDPESKKVALLWRGRGPVPVVK